LSAPIRIAGATEKRQRSRAKPGDVVAIHGHRLGETERLGEILEVFGEPGHEHFRVRWDDDRESVFYPGNDAIIRKRRRKKEVKP
jgi:hypothetical protein